MYTPEAKIKRFLDALAYFLLLGNTDGIETNYRRVMHAKREIPVSNCPADVSNIMYGSGGTSEASRRDEYDAFATMLEKLDQSALPYEAKQVQRKKQKSMFNKKNKRGIHGGEWLRVDTDGKFWVGDQQYIINDQEIQYQPVKTEYGDYYAMDRILFSGGLFYDMNYDDVAVQPVGAET